MFFSPLLRFAREDAVMAPPGPRRLAGGGMKVPPFRDLAGWLAEIDRQSGLMRCRRPLYDRFDRTARTLMPARIRACCDAEAIAELVRRPARGALSGRP